MLTDIMIDDPVVVKVNTDQEDIAYLFEKYDLTSAWVMLETD